MAAVAVPRLDTGAGVEALRAASCRMSDVRQARRARANAPVLDGSGGTAPHT